MVNTFCKLRLNCKGIWADELDQLYPKKSKYPGSPRSTLRCMMLKSRCSALLISTVSGFKVVADECISAIALHTIPISLDMEAPEYQT